MRVGWRAREMIDGEYEKDDDKGNAIAVTTPATQDETPQQQDGKDGVRVLPLYVPMVGRYTYIQMDGRGATVFRSAWPSPSPHSPPP